MNRIKSPGHAALALTLIAFGIMGLVKGDLTAIWDADGIPMRHALGYATALVCLLTGIGLFFPRTAAVSARALLVASSLWLLTIRAPAVLHSINVGTTWPFAQTMVMIAAAWVLCCWFAGMGGLRIAQAIYGVALIPFGLAHFLYLGNTTVLIPHWLLWPTFWAYFTGAALIAAGVGVLTGVYARWAAMLSAIELGVFTVVVWVPRMLTGHVTPFQRSEFVVSWGLTAAAWVVAESYSRGVMLLRRDAQPDIIQS